MNGVDINDNVLGTPNNLFIEDAIQEVQVLTSGISAEYGRFSGGIVNVITRSGGNVFSGAFRTNLTNPAWSVETPVREVGGHVAREQAVADLRGDGGRTLRAQSPRGSSAARASSGRRPRARSRRRGFRSRPRTTTRGTRRKLTGTIAPGHTLQGTFIDSRTDLRQPSLGASHRSGDDHHAVDAEPHRRGDVARRARPAHVCRGAVLAEELAAAERRRHQRGDRRLAVPDARRTPACRRTSSTTGPYFDSTDPEERNNRQLTASVSQMLASRARWARTRSRAASSTSRRRASAATRRA